MAKHEPIPEIPLTDNDYDELFNYKTYLIHTTVGVDHQYQQLVTVDTAAGPNLIDEKLFTAKWPSKVQIQDNLPRVLDANGAPFVFIGVVPMYFIVGSLTTLLWYEVLKIPARRILIRTC